MPPTNDTAFLFQGSGHTRSEADQRDCQARWQWMLRHVESVIRLRQVNPREAHVLVCVARQSADHLAGAGPEVILEALERVLAIQAAREAA